MKHIFSFSYLAKTLGATFFKVPVEEYNRFDGAYKELSNHREIILIIDPPYTNIQFLSFILSKLQFESVICTVIATGVDTTSFMTLLQQEVPCRLLLYSEFKTVESQKLIYSFPSFSKEDDGFILPYDTYGAHCRTAITRLETFERNNSLYIPTFVPLGAYNEISETRDKFVLPYNHDDLDLNII